MASCQDGGSPNNRGDKENHLYVKPQQNVILISEKTHRNLFIICIKTEYFQGVDNSGKERIPESARHGKRGFQTD